MLLLHHVLDNIACISFANNEKQMTNNGRQAPNDGGKPTLTFGSGELKHYIDSQI